MAILLKIDWKIFFCILFLLSFSILVIYSSSPILAFQQIFFAFFGFLAFFTTLFLDYKIFKSFTPFLYIMVIFLLIMLLIIGVEVRGSIRWISFGIFNFQPSEFAKPVIVLILANFWVKNIPTLKNIIKSLALVAPVGILVFKQPDLGSFLSLLAIWMGILFASRISFKQILVLLTFFILIIPLIWSNLHDYQKQRIMSFIDPQRDPLGVGYNIIQSTIAVGSGQFLGRGLGHGTQSRLQFLPEARTDFIFASIAEELGFLGSLVILVIYFFLIAYLLKIATLAEDAFGYLITFGVVSVLLFQVIVNIGMNIGLFPITGITLPLISYGGSSIITTLILLGIVSSVSRQRKKVDHVHIN